MSPVWNHWLRIAATVASGRRQYPWNMMFGRLGRTITSPGTFTGTSRSSSSTMRTSNAAQRLPEDPEAANAPRDNQVISAASVMP